MSSVVVAFESSDPHPDFRTPFALIPLHFGPPMYAPMIPCLLSLILGCLLGAAPLRQQGASTEKPPVAHAFFVAGPSFTGIIDEQGVPQWSAPRAGARDGWVLPNGHILIAWGDEALEFGSDRAVVWRYRIQAPNKEISTVERLANGHTLVTELGAEPRLREVSREGDVVHEIPLEPATDNVHMQTRMARKLSNGDYLVPHLLAHAVKCYGSDGTLRESFPTDLEELGGRAAENWPFTAIRLGNGNTLVGCTHGNKVIELDGEGQVVWKVDNGDMGGIIQDACGVQRLPNGNTVVASYNAREGIKLFEVTRAKELVWSYSGPHRVHHFQILTTNGEPLPGPPLK